MPIKNYTTGVPEEKTVHEIMSLLAQKGARSIRIDYDDLNRPESVSFIVIVMELPIPIKLPCNFDGVFKALANEYKDRYARSRFERNAESKAQARRVAWRIVKNWIEAQMALIEAGQASLIQVFLPYAVTQDGPTMFEKFLAQVSSQRTLTAGSQTA